MMEKERLTSLFVSVSLPPSFFVCCLLLLCSEEKGGDACYLRSYPEGYGLPFEADRRGDFLSLNFMLNDLRKFPAPPMVFYQEVALKWNAREDLTPLSLQVSHMAPGHLHPFSTRLVTKRPSFLWSTSKWMVDGKVLVSPQDQFPWFHAHRKFCQVSPRKKK